ncbi:MAG: DUF2156 domain-containing protein [Clostridia bacterium]|nr:DUF2156 domain-containing protein [Clostridia bacterium]
MERKKITIKDRKVFDKYIKNQENSTYNFTNMFMWAGGGTITYAETEGCLALFFQGEKQPVTVSYPVGDGDKRAAVKALSAYIEAQDLRPVFRNLSREMVEEMEAMFPDCFTFVEDRNTADYVYETEKMIHLPGKKLHAKRNHLNYFKNNYAYTYRRLEKGDGPDCLALFDKWIAEKEDMPLLGSSREATKKILDHFDELPVLGGGIYIDGVLVAFSIGEPITENMALIHLEFGGDYRGIYNAMSSEFCADAWQDFTYVNREEDMGIEGLRHTKLALRPAKLIEKFNAIQVKPL